MLAPCDKGIAKTVWRGRGACAGASRGWLIALEDRKDQRIATDEGAKWINCANVLLDAVDDGRLSVAQADEISTRSHR